MVKKLECKTNKQGKTFCDKRKGGKPNTSYKKSKKSKMDINTFMGKKKPAMTKAKKVKKLKEMGVSAKKLQGMLAGEVNKLYKQKTEKKPARKRRTKKEMSEARKMGMEDVDAPAPKPAKKPAKKPPKKPPAKKIMPFEEWVDSRNNPMEEEVEEQIGEEIMDQLYPGREWDSLTDKQQERLMLRTNREIERQQKKLYKEWKKKQK
jgi:hypothetical protein